MRRGPPPFSPPGGGGGGGGGWGPPPRRGGGAGGGGGGRRRRGGGCVRERLPRMAAVAQELGRVWRAAVRAAQRAPDLREVPADRRASARVAHDARQQG